MDCHWIFKNYSFINDKKRPKKLLYLEKKNNIGTSINKIQSLVRPNLMKQKL